VVAIKFAGRGADEEGMPLHHAGIRRALPVLALGAVFAAGCGGQTTDITAAVADSNKTYKGEASFDCPDKVDGGQGTKFDCTLKGTKSGKSAPIKLKLTKDGIAPLSQKQLADTLQRVGAS
jgi:hypothetical protein